MPTDQSVSQIRHQPLPVAQSCSQIPHHGRPVALPISQGLSYTYLHNRYSSTSTATHITTTNHAAPTFYTNSTTTPREPSAMLPPSPPFQPQTGDHAVISIYPSEVTAPPPPPLRLLGPPEAQPPFAAMGFPLLLGPPVGPKLHSESPGLGLSSFIAPDHHASSHLLPLVLGSHRMDDVGRHERPSLLLPLLQARCCAIASR